MAASRRAGSGLMSSAIALFLTALGAIVRAPSALRGDFPVNDGGLFYRMIEDLQRSWPLLPTHTSYNELQIPFAYPPFALYLGASLDGLLPEVTVMRILPLVFSTLAVPAVFLLARAMAGGLLIPTMAGAAFALLPRSFEWTLMGGGLTRSVGLLLAILTLWVLWRLLDDLGWAHALGLGILAGLTALSHPQGALFALLSGLVFVAFRARTRRAVLRLAVAAAVVGAVVLPWLLTVIIRFGPDPLLSASGTQPGPVVGFFNLLDLNLSGSRISPVLSVLAAAALLVLPMRGRWLLPAWLALVLVLDARGGATYASVPTALLAAHGLKALVIAPLWRDPPEARRPLQYARRYPVSATLVGIVLMASVIDGVGSQSAPNWPAVPLSPGHRQAMAWAAENTSHDAAVLVVSGRPWPIDANAEWFPVLADRRSVATVQGTEWLGGTTYNRALAWSDELRRCAVETPQCLEDWSKRWATPYTHVFIPKGSVSGPLGEPDCCVALRQMLRDSRIYDVVYDGPGATIFKWVGEA